MGSENIKETPGYENEVALHLTPTARIYWLDDRILRLDVIQESEIDAEDLAVNISSLRVLGKGQPDIVLVDARGNWTLSKEARELMSVDETVRNISACAFVVDSLATRLIVNFFIREGKLELTIKVFSDESAALHWLNEKAGK